MEYSISLVETSFNYSSDVMVTKLFSSQVKNDGGRIDEQIDKNTGAQASAASLTWSYANVLHALHVRKNVVKERAEILGF